MIGLYIGQAVSWDYDQDGVSMYFRGVHDNRLGNSKSQSPVGFILRLEAVHKSLVDHFKLITLRKWQAEAYWATFHQRMYALYQHLHISNYEQRIPNGPSNSCHLSCIRP
jgi:hypothetical protein